MFIFYFIVDTFLEAVSVRWLFTVFLFAKNHRTAVTKPSIKHCTRYGWPGPGASLSPMSGAEKTPLSRAMYLQNRWCWRFNVPPKPLSRAFLFFHKSDWTNWFLTEKSTPQNFVLADLKSSKRYIKRSKTKSKLRVIKFLGSVKKIGIGKKKLGCKKNSHVKKMSIPRPRFPQQICLQIMISCVCALSLYFLLRYELKLSYLHLIQTPGKQNDHK